MHFSITNCFYLFKEDCRATNFFLFERLRHSKPPSHSKNRQKLHKMFKSLNFQVFLSILVWIWCIFLSQIAFTSSKKTAGQRIFSFLNVFDILSHQVILEKQTKVAWNFQKPEVSGIFVIFGLNLRHFYKSNCIDNFDDASWTTKAFLVECF